MEITTLSTKGQIVIPERLRLKTIWKEIDAGKADKYSEKEFFKAMKQW